MKLNRRLISILLVICLVVGMIPNVFAAISDRAYGSVAVQGYARTLTFFNGLLPVSNTEGKWGLIDKEGNVVVPFEYENIGPMGKELRPPRWDLGLFWAYDGNTNYIIDRTGRKLMDGGSYIHWWENGFWLQDTNSWYTWDFQPSTQAKIWGGTAGLEGYASSYRYGEYYIVSTADGKSGVLDSNLNVVIPIVYENIGTFSDNAVATFICVKGGESCDYYDSQCRQVTAYDYIRYRYPDATLLVKKDGLTSLLNRDGQVVVPMMDLDGDYEISNLFPDGSVSVAIRRSYSNYTNAETRIYRNGAFVRSINGYFAQMLSPNGLRFTTDGKTYGLMNLNGQVVLSQLYGEIYNSADDGFFIVRQGAYPNATYGLVDESGQFIYRPVYESVNSLGSNRYLLSDGIRYGVGNSSGNILIPIRYQYPKMDNGANIMILNDGTSYCAYNNNCEPIIPNSNVPIKQFGGRDLLFDDESYPLGYGLVGWEEYEREAYGATTTVALCYETDNGRATCYYDYETGEVKGTVPYWASVPTADGYYAYVDSNDNYRIANINDEGTGGGGDVGQTTGKITIAAKSLITSGLLQLRLKVTFQDFANVDSTVSDLDVIENAGVLYWTDSRPSTSQAVLGKQDGVLRFRHNSGSLYRGVYEYPAYLEVNSWEYAKTYYFRPYMVVGNEIVYGDLESYGVLDYVDSQMTKSNTATNKQLKNLLAALLKYGAAAQIQFGENTNHLADSVLSSYVSRGLLDSSAVAMNWTDSYLTDLVAPTTAMTTNFPASGNLKSTGNTLLLEGAISIKSYMSIGKDISVVNGASNIRFYFWDQETYTAIRNAGGKLTKSNASYTTAPCDLTQYSNGNWEYIGYSDGIYAMDYDDTVYYTMCYTDRYGEEHCSGVKTYSPEAYAANMLAKSSTSASLANVIKWMVVYGERAKAYFG